MSHDNIRKHVTDSITIFGLGSYTQLLVSRIIFSILFRFFHNLAAKKKSVHLSKLKVLCTP
jgi:hypothetical protein